jgi:hypothetical protein
MGSSWSWVSVRSRRGVVEVVVEVVVILSMVSM